MKLREILSGMEILETNADPELEIGDISYDSRQTGPGDLFVAVKGFETDGHRYVGAAGQKGARAVLGERAPAAGAVFVPGADSRGAKKSVP